MKKIDAPGKVIFICAGKKCGHYSKDIHKRFKEPVKENGLKKAVLLQYMGCTGNCKCAPILSLQPMNIWIGEIVDRDIKVIIRHYFL